MTRVEFTVGFTAEERAAAMLALEHAQRVTGSTHVEAGQDAIEGALRALRVAQWQPELSPGDPMFTVRSPSAAARSAVKLLDELHAENRR